MFLPEGHLRKRRPPAHEEGEHGPCYGVGTTTTPSRRCSVLLLPTILADLPFGKPQRTHLGRPAAAAGRPAGPPHVPPPGPLRRPLPPHPQPAGGPALRLCGPQPGRPVRDGARTRTTWPGPGTAPSSPRAAAGCPGSAGAGTTGKAGWPGASSSSSCRSWTWTSTVRTPSTAACSRRRRPVPAGRRAAPDRRGPRWGPCWPCSTGPWPWSTGPTSTSSWATATTPASPWSRGWTHGA